jgi:hypothetical protein
MKRAKLSVDRIRYFYAAIFPFAAMLRLLTRGRDPGQGSDMRPAPAVVGWALQMVLKAERLLIFPINVMAGLSVVAVARTSSRPPNSQQSSPQCL